MLRASQSVEHTNPYTPFSKGEYNSWRLVGDNSMKPHVGLLSQGVHKDLELRELTADLCGIPRLLTGGI